jgi:pimeloyl-ACP methyl ester carboxylesterase
MTINKSLLSMASNMAEDSYDYVPMGRKIESRLTSTTCFVLKREDMNIVVFRGTQQLSDWIFNLTAIPVRYAKRWVHGGFAIAHKSVWKEIRKTLDPTKKLLLCGHSLGGALAELSACKTKDFKEVHLVTFGKPNVFFRLRRGRNYKTALKHLRTQLSVVAGSDVIARLPRFLYGPAFGQTMLYFSVQGDLVDPPAELRRKEFRKNRLAAFSDHAMNGVYKRRVGKCKPLYSW